MKRKILSLAVALAMALSLLPVTALATGEDYQDWTSTDSLPTSGTYRLTQDVTISTTSSKYPTVTGTLVLDLAGRTITVSGDGYYAYFVNNSNASLTIQDSVGNGKITNSGITAVPRP